MGYSEKKNFLKKGTADTPTKAITHIHCYFALLRLPKADTSL